MYSNVFSLSWRGSELVHSSHTMLPLPRNSSSVLQGRQDRSLSTKKLGLGTWLKIENKHQDLGSFWGNHGQGRPSVPVIQHWTDIDKRILRAHWPDGPAEMMSSRFSERSNMDSDWRKHTTSTSGLYIYIHTPPHLHTHTHSRTQTPTNEYILKLKRKKKG